MADIARGLLVIDHVADAGLVGVDAREERGAGGAAATGVIELREAQAVLRQGVEVRRGDFAAVAPDI